MNPFFHLECSMIHCFDTLAQIFYMQLQNSHVDMTFATGHRDAPTTKLMKSFHQFLLKTQKQSILTVYFKLFMIGKDHEQ